MLYPCVYTLRHTADDKVVIICLQQPGMENILNLLFLLNGLIVAKERRVNGLKKFVKAKRTDVKQINHSYGIRFGLGKECAQQTAGSNNVIVAC